jgi:uncharacterized protein YbjT (DUF2867 family)
VFSFIPPSYTERDFSSYQDRVSKAIVQAIANSGVQRVVNLSSIGANVSEQTGPILILRKHEQRLNGLQNLVSLVHLRPGFFMENLNAFIPQILSQKVIRSPLDENLPIAMCATRDIGWKAADFLDSTANFSNLVFEFVGPKEVTMKDVALAFASCLDIPQLRYEQISFDDARREMMAQHMPEQVVDSMLEMYRAFNEGKITPTQELKPSHHGTTTLEAYLAHITHRLFAQQHL